MQTRDETRRLWTQTGLQVCDLSGADLSALRRELNRQMKDSGLIRESLRMDGRIRTRKGPKGLLFAELRCRSDYFVGRQAVTMEQDGFIGFAGWADETNVQPILTGFSRWVAAMTSGRMAA